MIPRHITSSLLDALSDSPVVLLNGARQTGKSTLAQGLASGGHEGYRARYLTLDEAAVLAAASTDPAGFIAGLDGPTVLDEVQRAPGLFLALKASVDRDRRPGRFLLTGSAHVLMLPRIADALVGRMEIQTLWPLSQGELEGTREGFIDALFAPRLPSLPQGLMRAEVLERAQLGGYPEVQRRAPGRRRAWFSAYVTTIVQRDVRDLANIEGLTALPRLLSLIAARATGLLNFAELSRSSGLPQTTLKRYLALLETTFLVQTLPAWSGNLSKRLVRSPKLLLGDTGLLAHLQGLGERRSWEDSPAAGPLLENLVVMELRKQSAWSRAQPQLFHFRTQTGQGVDVVLEDSAGRLVGLEVKASATVSGADFTGLKALSEQTGTRFHRGVVLHAGESVVPFGPNLHALPLSCLWRLGAAAQPER